MSQFEPIHGFCLCKALQFTLLSPPMFSNFCHCTKCQRRNGAPFGHAVMFPINSIQWNLQHDETPQTLADGTTVPGRYSFNAGWDTEKNAPNTSGAGAIRCTRCHCAIGALIPQMGAIALFSTTFERYDATEGKEKEGKIKAWEILKPTGHLFYGERLVDVKDGLKKWEGFPGTAEIAE